MPCASSSLTTQSPLTWRAGNIARSRLSGGRSLIRTGPRKFLGGGSQTSLNRILFNVCLNPVELYTGSNQSIKALLLPEWSVGAQEKIGLVSRKSLEGTQPLAGKHMRSDQQMNMIRHHDERMELIPPECAISVSQRCHHHFCNFRPPQKQRSIRARVQEPVDGHKCPARRNQSLRWEHTTAGKTTMQPERDKQRLFHHVPVGQPPFIMPHSSWLCFCGGETLIAMEGGQSWPQPPFRRPSRLKAGCGHDCPPSDWWL